MARILVTGVGGPAGKNVARMLKERGHDVIGVDMKEMVAPGVTFLRVPPADDPRFLEELVHLAEREKAELLVPTVTEELPILAGQWRARSSVPALIGSSDAVATANDKLLTSRRLESHGVCVPRYRLPSQVASAEDLGRSLGWPCLSKPRTGRGGRGVTVWHEEQWPSVAALDDRFILQEFMPGTDYAPNLFISQRPGIEPLVVVLEKTILKEGIVGNALEVTRVATADVAALACAAARAAGFTGQLDVDIRRRSDGMPAVLEINARFGANIAFAPEVLDAALAEAELSP
jgi:carbamoylphosphate synthase large subunit